MEVLGSCNEHVPWKEHSNTLKEKNDRNDTGEILCRQLPVYGKGDVKSDKYDEAGYVALPPCLWGEEDGLLDPFELPYGTPLLSIKKNRNTRVGHFGEMASWQMRGLCKGCEPNN